jgi:hypothetical protein
MKYHTPGPWFVVPDPQWAGKHPNHASRCICNVPQFAEVHPPTEGENGEWHVFHDQHGKTVCLMTDTLEITANAHLIASAPELLAALENLRNSIRHGSTCRAPQAFPCSCDADQLWQMSGAIIAKAKGGAK